jgi:hypothetical protein
MGTRKARAREAVLLRKRIYKLFKRISLAELKIIN